MTIQDLLDSSISIQGGVTIKLWSDDEERHKTLYNSEDFKQYEVPSSIKNWSISCMYTDSDDKGYIVIEVE